MIPAIQKRRSVRKFTDAPVERYYIEEIVKAGILAPSAKNRQPWKFIVTAESAKKNALEAMKLGLLREKTRPLLPQSKNFLAGAENSLRIMQTAPVVIFAVNPFGLDVRRALNPEERVYEICNYQSLGAAIQNMTLTATELGLGSLWICDTYFAYDELKNLFGAEGELAAALAIGYADEQPEPRPRKSPTDVAEWRE